MKAMYPYLLVLLIAASGCSPDPADQQVNELNKLDSDQDTAISCGPSSDYACHPVYQESADTDLPPAVCGCIPRCGSGLSLDVKVAEGYWPDGTRKGDFSCK